jgi:acetyltransferase-like isoleucine patch superfamily enzyme
MKPLIRQIFYWLKYKIRYPRNKIDSTVNLSNAIDLAPGVSVGAFSSISNARLGHGTIIHSHCSLQKTNTEDCVAVYPHSRLNEVEIGRFSYIASNAAIVKTKIGRFCSIGPDLICGYGDHPARWISTSPVFFSTLKQCGVSFSDTDLFDEHKPIAIGHDVWIGARVFIRGGLTIGSGAIVAAGAVG